jgi:hypothetical protein
LRPAAARLPSSTATTNTFIASRRSMASLKGRGGLHASELNQESNCGQGPSVRDFVHREPSRGGCGRHWRLGGRLRRLRTRSRRQLVQPCLPLFDGARTGFGVNAVDNLLLIDHCARASENQRKPCINLKITLRQNKTIFS